MAFAARAAPSRRALAALLALALLPAACAGDPAAHDGGGGIGDTGVGGADGGHDVIACPVLRCPACPFGYQPGLDGCGTCRCNPPPPCTAEECRAAPVPGIFCVAPETPVGTCSRRDDGRCAWQLMCARP